MEAILPTLARVQGLEIEDLGGDGEFCRPDRRNMHYMGTYSGTPSTAETQNATFRFRPPVSTRYYEEEPGQFPVEDKLYHPVKIFGEGERGLSSKKP
jgi:hypothetical protein